MWRGDVILGALGPIPCPILFHFEIGKEKKGSLLISKPSSSEKKDDGLFRPSRVLSSSGGTESEKVKKYE